MSGKFSARAQRRAQDRQDTKYRDLVGEIENEFWIVLFIENSEDYDELFRMYKAQWLYNAKAANQMNLKDFEPVNLKYFAKQYKPEEEPFEVRTRFFTKTLDYLERLR